MRKVVFLFDIDGTLLSTGGAGRRAMVRAFTACHERGGACDFPFGGMTDRAIARRGLEALGVEATTAAIDAVLEVYLSALALELPASATVVHPGVEAAVERCLAREGVAVGLGTGNLEPGARLKLGHVGLADRFAFGGYGSDHEDRAELLRVGALRGAARLGIAATDARVIVIGDTPRDVDAARAIGAECLAVATGAFSLTTLAEHAPTHLVPTLADPAALAVLTS